MDLKLDINLKRMAFVSLASEAYNHPNIESKIQTYFCSKRKKGKLKSWYRIIELATEKINLHSLPSGPIQAELVDVIYTLGLKICDWHRFLKESHIFEDVDREKLYDLYAKKIFWTNYGFVNHEQIIKSWLSNPEVDSIKVFKLSCCFCSVANITALWEKVSKNFENLDYKELYKKYGSHLIAYWSKFQQKDLENVMENILQNDPEERYDAWESLDTNMFFVSAFKGYPTACKFFWGKMSNEERRRSIIFGLNEALVRYHRLNRSRFYSRERYLEIIRFLTTFLSEETEREYFVEHPTFNIHVNVSVWICIALGYNWPMQALSGKVINKYGHLFGFWEYSAGLKMQIHHFMETKLCRSFPFFREYNVYRQIFIILWSKMMLLDEPELNLANYFVHVLLKMKDVRTANWVVKNCKTVLNYDHLSLQCHTYDHAISAMCKKFISCTQKNENYLLWEFTDDESIWGLPFEIKNKIISLYKAIFNDDFDSVINSFSEEDKKFLKCKINLDYPCFYWIVKNKLRAADDFLDWIFDGDQEKTQNYKSTFRNEKVFTKCYIFKLWRKSSDGNFETVKKVTDDFIQWFCSSDEVVSYKRSRITDYENSIVHEIFKKSHRFDTIPEFLEFFGHENPVEHSRTLVDESALSQKFENYMKKNMVDYAIDLLRWRYDTEKERESFIRDFVSTSEGAKCCKLFIGKYCGSNRETEYRKFMEFFIRPAEEIENLKCELEKWCEVFHEKYEELVDRNQEEKNELKNSCISDDSDDEDEKFDRCYDDENNKLFLNLLNSFGKKSE